MGKTWIVLAAAMALAFGACRSGSGGDGDGDGDGDVDGDGDTDTDVDSDSDSDGCSPALGVCDPVAQCGCAAGQMCNADLHAETFETIEVCVEDPGGTGVQDDVCTEAPCAAGYRCRPWSTPEGDPTAMCRRWCVVDDDCAEFPGSFCSDYLQFTLPDESTATIEPYALCTPENVSLGIGTADFTVCTGMPEDCPGNPPWTYTISGTDVNGSCSIDPGEPRLLTFSLRDTDQSVSITANEIQFVPSGDEFVTATGGSRTRFSFFIPGRERPYSTTEIASPPGPGTCEVLVRFDEADSGFEIRYSCNEIEDTFTGEALTTLDGAALGHGTAAMDGCDVDG